MLAICSLCNQGLEKRSWGEGGREFREEREKGREKGTLMGLDGSPKWRRKKAGGLAAGSGRRTWDGGGPLRSNLALH